MKRLKRQTLPIGELQLVRLLRILIYDLQQRAPELAENKVFQNDLASLECAIVRYELEKEFKS